MSGIEIAGLVLAAIPLLISAIEHYNDGLDPLKAFIQWKGKLAQVLRDLWHQHTFYYMTLRLLLEGITTDEELDQMMTDPRCDLWKSGKICANLRTKLGIAYLPYLSTIEDVEAILMTISKHVNLEKSSRVLDSLFW
jgi:hypothetical protein